MKYARAIAPATLGTIVLLLTIGSSTVHAAAAVEVKPKPAPPKDDVALVREAAVKGDLAYESGTLAELKR